MYGSKIFIMWLKHFREIKLFGYKKAIKKIHLVNETNKIVLIGSKVLHPHGKQSKLYFKKIVKMKDLFHQGRFPFFLKQLSKCKTNFGKSEF